MRGRGKAPPPFPIPCDKSPRAEVFKPGLEGKGHNFMVISEVMDLGIESPAPTSILWTVGSLGEQRSQASREKCVCVHEGVISEVMAHDLRCTNAPSQGL